MFSLYVHVYLVRKHILKELYKYWNKNIKYCHFCYCVVYLLNWRNCIFMKFSWTPAHFYIDMVLATFVGWNREDRTFIYVLLSCYTLYANPCPQHTHTHTHKQSWTHTQFKMNQRVSLCKGKIMRLRSKTLFQVTVCIHFLCVSLKLTCN